jgi:hypothetical protein
VVALWQHNKAFIGKSNTFADCLVSKKHSWLGNALPFELAQPGSLPGSS